jgi:hypothetical protein
VLHTSLLNIIVVGFKILPLGSHAPMPAPSPPIKTVLELALCNCLQSCRHITPDVINVTISFLSIFPLSSITEKSRWELDPVNGEGVPAQLFVY